MPDAYPLAAVFADTLLAGRQIVACDLPGSDDQAHFIEIAPAVADAACQCAHERRAATGRWPVVVDIGPTHSGFLWWRHARRLASRVATADLFSRVLFENAGQDESIDVSPQAILARAERVDVAGFLAKLTAEATWQDEEEFEYELNFARRLLLQRRRAPTLAALRASGARTRHELEHWLMNWEAKQGLHQDCSNLIARAAPLTDTALLLLPVPDPWATLAYLHWWGCGSENEHYIALGRSWQRRFGAELVAHDGIVLECRVSRSPTTLAEAWELACEHDLASPGTLRRPDVALRDYARALVGSERWFFWERP